MLLTLNEIPCICFISWTWRLFFNMKHQFCFNLLPCLIENYYYFNKLIECLIKLCE